ncbi:MAG: cyclic 2,3-diphosphoglycerate synthase [Anaerolineae bacterium]
MSRTRVIILGAAGRDFHNFNLVYRDNPYAEVVAFTATQIPGAENRVYPPSLAGSLYPDGIPIYPEADLERLIAEHSVDEVIFAYSDGSHEYVMHRASRVLAAGADFRLLGPNRTTLTAQRPVVAVCAVRTGSGKSQTSRYVVRVLREMGRRVVAVRHPMPYGALAEQVVQRFAAYDDLDRYRCTLEEREEYEPYLDMGAVIYAGVDYARILAQAEAEADVIVWDGGNNDLPFYTPDLHIVVADPLRPGHELRYHPGEANLRMADVVVINKEDTAAPGDIETVRTNIRAANPDALMVDAASRITVDDGAALAGKRVLVVEDGPTLTHGDMPFGAGRVAAERLGAHIVAPVEFAVGSIRDVFAHYPQARDVLPAMGYSEGQIRDLEATIRATNVDAVILGTPIDLRRVMRIDVPAVRVRYELECLGQPTLEDIIRERLSRETFDRSAARR